ncbi:MAG: glycosyltransferase [Actinomycetota bacterium]
MNVVLIGLHFPPELHVASGRVGHLAAAFLRHGHDCTVFTREPPVAGYGVADLERADVVRISDPSESLRQRIPELPPESGTGQRRRLRAFARGLLKRASRAVPLDRHALWALRVLWSARKLQQADVVIVSVPPLSALFVAWLLAIRKRAKLVVDYRDALVGNPYNPQGLLLRATQGALERLFTTRADLLTAATVGLADQLGAKLGATIHTVFNGYDADLLTEARTRASVANSLEARALSIVHCGHIFPGKRDPSALFAALRLIDAPLEVHFYGTNLEHLRTLPDFAPVQDQVFIHGPVSHLDSLTAQVGSDILLYLSWNDPRDAPVLSGKLLEYIGTGKPILMIGYEHGEAARLLHDSGSGQVANTASSIADFIRAQLGLTRGAQAFTDPRLDSNYSRRTQSNRFVDLVMGA